MANILDRFSTIIKSNINALLDKVNYNLDLPADDFTAKKIR